ncbi:MAG: DUF5651 domain-containing protein [Sporomusaceae bacterium]|nr:DUF5651 domain-containing protein [Sporomusaceae bacterium]
MNSYLSKEEKDKFVRATAMLALIDEAIKEYSKVKSIPPEFLKYLRMGRSWLNKALAMRSAALDDDAKRDFMKYVLDREYVFVRTAEAKDKCMEMAAMDTVLHIDLADFEAWYSSVIETTCKTCYSKEYKECQIREVLTKYGVYPINAAATDKCQYSYIGTPEAQDLPGTAVKNVPAEVYNAALATLNFMRDTVNEKYLPRIKQLELELEQFQTVHEDDQLKEKLVDLLYFQDDRPENPSNADIIDRVKDLCNQFDEQAKENKLLQAQVKQLEEKITAAAADQEKAKEKYPVQIILNSGISFENLLPAHMTKIIIDEIQRPKHARSTVAQYVDGEFIAIDLQEIAGIRADKLPSGQWVKQRIHTLYGVDKGPVTPAAINNPASGHYRVECRCGAEYFATMSKGRNKALCRICSAAVFSDYNADGGTDQEGNHSTLMTNRYFVKRENMMPGMASETPVKESKPTEQTEPKTNAGTDYIDPLASLVG